MLILFLVTLIQNSMKIQKLILVAMLVILVGTLVQAQDSTLNVLKKKVKSLNIQSLNDVKVQKLKNLKITSQNLSDVKDAVKPVVTKVVGDSDVLIIVNGAKISYKEYSTIDVKNITSMTVVKDKKALVEYTAKKSCPALKELFTKKYNKAIVIETKQKATATK
jgi:hypothetical protein